MELAIPLAALTGLYVTSRHNNENKIECENFENYHENNNIDEEEREKQETMKWEWRERIHPCKLQQR